MSEGGSDYTVYTVEVTPVNGGDPWRVQHRFKDFMALRSALTALAAPGNLPQCWNDVSKARSVTGRHRCVSIFSLSFKLLAVILANHVQSSHCSSLHCVYVLLSPAIGTG